MQRINWKQAIFAVLTGMLGVQLVGCGSSGTENTTAQKEFVYVPEYQKLEAENGVDQVFMDGDLICYRTGSYDEEKQEYTEYLAMLKIGEDTPKMFPLDFGENSSVQRIAADGTGNFYAVVSTYVYDEEEGDGGEAAGDDALLEEGETGEAEEETDGTEEAEADSAEEADSDSAEEADSDSAEEAEADSAEEGNAEDGAEEAEYKEELSYEVVEEDNGISRGMMYGVATTVYGAGDEGGWSGPSSRIMELCTLSRDGSILERMDISNAVESNVDPYVQEMEMDKEGNLYLCFDQSVIVIGGDGNRICKIDVDNWINDMFSAKDGSVYAVYYGENGMETHLVDIHAKAMGDAVENIMVGRNGGYTFASGTDSDVLFSVDSSLYAYSFGNEAPEEILNWIDCNIDTDNVRSFALLEDGRVLALLSGWDNESGMSTTELVYLTKKKGSEVPEQKIITYGTLYLDYYVRKEIIEFNRTNQEYRIEVKEYVTDDSMEGYGSGQEQMNADIVSGKGPDLIELSNGNMRMYAAKGILEDLYPYMDADEEINKEDYLESVRKAYEVDGKLYTMPTRFYVNTVLAKASKVGERSSITLDEVMDIADGLPKDAQIYEYATKESILMTNIMMNMDEYVDWNTGECKFNSEDFLKALEFSNRFDAEFKYDRNDMSRPEKIKQDRLLMVQTSISSMQEYILYKAMFGEPMVFCGYPTSKANGSFLSHDGSILGINAKSKNKDGAWQFIRRQLTKEVQESNSGRGGFGFPVMKSALEKQFEEDMTEEYYEDVDGSKKRSQKTTWGYDDFSVRIFAAKDYEVETIRNLIDSTNTRYEYDEKMMEIITEEANAFFEGQKTAKEVADIIQNRIQVYVNENK